MPTIIDELIVTLGLDTSKFNQGQKDAVAALQKLSGQQQKTSAKYVKLTEAELAARRNASEAIKKQAADQKAAVRAAAKAEADDRRKAAREQAAEVRAKKQQATLAAQQQARETAAVNKASLALLKRHTAEDRAAARADELERNRAEDQKQDEAKAQEERNKKVGESYNKLRRDLLLFAGTVLGIKGIKDLVTDISEADAASGRLAVNLDSSVGELTLWEQAVKRVGGTAGGFDQSIQNIVSGFQQFQLTGQSSAIPFFQRLGVTLADSSGHLRNATALMLDLNRAVQGMDPALANELLSGAGISDAATRNLLIQTKPAALRSTLSGIRGRGLPTAQDASNAANIQADLTDVRQSAENLGRTILNDLTPSIDGLLKELDAWFQKSGPGLTKQASEDVKEFVGYLRSVDWKAIGGDVRQVVAEADSLAQSIGGWNHLMEGFIALWAASSLAPIAAAVAATGPIGILVASFAALALSYEKISGKKFAPPSNPSMADGGVNDNGQHGFSLGGWFNATRHGIHQWSTDQAAKWGGMFGGADANRAAAAGLFTGLEHKDGLPSNLLDTIWKIESDRGRSMTSSAGAQGHFQFMPGTAAQYGVSNPYDLQNSASGAAAYWADLLRQYGGDTQKAAAAYNWGPGNLDKDLSRYGSAWMDHLPSETSAYVQKVDAGLAAGDTNNTTHVHGDIHVHTQAADAHGIAGAIKGSLRNPDVATQANSGLT